MKIYIAGPMTGLPKYNVDKFNEAADYYRSMGHEVFNPAETQLSLDIQQGGATLNLWHTNCV